MHSENKNLNFWDFHLFEDTQQTSLQLYHAPLLLRLKVWSKVCVIRGWLRQDGRVLAGMSLQDGKWVPLEGDARTQRYTSIDRSELQTELSPSFLPSGDKCVTRAISSCVMGKLPIFHISWSFKWFFTASSTLFLLGSHCACLQLYWGLWSSETPFL